MKERPVMPANENVQLIHADCMEAMKHIADGSVDMILCDLPYGTTQNKWDNVIPFDGLWSAYWRVLKPGGVIALHASQPFTSALIMSQVKYFKHEWVWIKNRGSNFANTVREPMKEHESVLIFSKGKWTYNKQMQERSAAGLSRVKYDFNAVTQTENYGEFGAPTKNQGTLRVPSSYQRFNIEFGLHPTQKPVPLAEYLINTYTNEGDVVLDNCMGSGTTGVACVNTGRRFIGIEKEQKYVEVARRRIFGGSELEVRDASK